MTPIEIEIENFRSFGTRRAIAFGSPRLFAVLGDTGAGKSSILEAVTYALFNRSTWSGRNVKELIARGARSMSVTFRFSVGGDEFVISRVTPRQAGQPVQRLRCPARGIDVSAQSEVDAAIREALHVDAETFLHTVLLRQGMHAELLTKDPASRDKILAELFQLDDLARVDARAKALEARVGAFLDAYRGERAALGPDPAAIAAEAASALAGAEARLATAEETVAAARALDERIAALNAAHVDATERAARLAGVDALFDEFVSLDAVAAELDAAIVCADEALQAANGRRAGAQAALEGLAAVGEDAATLRERLSTCDAIASANDELARHRLLLAEAASGSEDATHALGAAEDHVCRSELAVRASQDALQEAMERFEAARLRHGQLTAALAASDAGRDAVERAAAEDAVKVHALAELQERASLSVQEHADAMAAQAEARVALERARHADQAAALAVDLHAGDACPICERPLPSSFAARTSAGLDAAIRAAAAASTAASASEAVLLQLEREIARAQGVRTQAVHNTEAAEDALRAARASLDALIRPGEDPWVAAGTASDELADEEAALVERRAEAERATAAHTEALAQRARAQERCAAQVERRDDAHAGVRRWRERLDERLAMLPVAERAIVEAGALDEVHDALTQAQERATAAERALEAAAVAVNDAVQRYGVLVAERAQRVVEPRARAIGRIAGVAALFALGEPPRDDDAVRAWAHDVVAAALRQRTRSEAEAAGAERDWEVTGSERRALVERVGGEPESVRTAALVDRGSAADRLRAANEKINRAAVLDAKIDRLTPVAFGLAQLHDALGARDFRAYATGQRQRRLLEAASAILREMRDGRYEFTPDFAILDHLTNEVRPPQTLSGGEKFLASLALSLGAVEIAAGAGARIEALFLDEGFDALDASTLPEAMLELHKRARGGRMICVITHVSEAAQFVADAMIVRQTADGSVVLPLDGPLDEDQAAAEGLVSRMAG